MTSTWAQLRALAALRWQITRGRGARAVLRLLPLVVLLLLYAATSGIGHLNASALQVAVRFAPTAFLGFAFLALVAPLTLGGGHELLPPQQLLAYPVRTRTQFLASLLLAPVNLVWVVQMLSVAAETVVLTRHGHLVSGALVSTAFVLGATACGQAIGWLVAGLRPTRGGRRTLALAGTACVLFGALLLLRHGRHPNPVEMGVGGTVAQAVAAGPGLRWSLTLGALFLVTALALVSGDHACRWALGRSGRDDRASGPGSLPRRTASRTTLGQLIAVDRASIWRAPALRLSGITFVLLSGVLVVSAAVPLPFLVILPALVATSAGLLFGVNVFSLDGSGALWLSSLPHRPKVLVLSKLTVLAGTVLGAMVFAELLVWLRNPGRPSLTEWTSVVMSALTCGTLVVATCLSLSVHHPHRADLHGPRDVIAPPGALAAASARLAAPVSFAGLVLEGASGTGVWWFPILLGMPILLGSALWLRRTVRTYAFDPVRRAHIIQVVSAG